MALKTEVNIRYRTPYMPGVNLPKETEDLMRKEISNMRKDLLKKQDALERSKYQANEKLKNELKDLNVKSLKNTREVWDTWNRLRNLELSNQTSVSGKNESRAKAIESFHMSGFTGINEKNYDKFTKIMDKVKTEFQALLWDSEQIVETFLELYDDGVFEGKTYDEMYWDMLTRIEEEIDDEYRTYNTESKAQKAYNATKAQLDRTNIAKEAFDVSYNRERITQKDINEYYYWRNKIFGDKK